MKQPSIRRMTGTKLDIDIDIGIDWAAAEGWNPGLRDGDSTFAADPQGFLVGLLGDTPVGRVSALK